MTRKYYFLKRIFQQHAKIPATELFWWMRQLAVLLQAKISLIDALQGLSLLSKRPALQRLTSQLKQDISQGLLFSQALQRQPDYFDAFTCQLMQAGESTASLPTALLQWITYQQQLRQVRQRLHKALFYPLLVMGVAFIIAVGLLWFIVPQFEQIFNSFQAPLPWLTRAVLKLASGIQQQGISILGSIFIGGGLFFFSQAYFPHLRKKIAFYQLRIPWLGRWQQYAIISRVMHTLVLSTAQHVPLVQALTLSSHVAQHWYYVAALSQVKSGIVRGETLATALEGAGCFDLFMVQLVRTGEQAGDLPHMLQKVAEWYDSQLEEAVAWVSQWLEPILMLVLGVFIGGLVIAMYLPIFQLGTVI